MNDSKIPLGGGFLIHEAGQEAIFAPEAFTDEQKLFAQTARRFIADEVEPLIEELEHPDENFSLMVKILKKAGDIGLLMIDVPETYGGLGLDKTTSMLCSEKISAVPSFSVSWGGHTGIGTLPITFFGTDAQKARWLPLLASGEKLAAYALTEPGSGSDAMAAKTTAVLNEAGTHYVLNGSKMWITNARFADVFVIFCQVDGDQFSAFIVEANSPGLEIGAEERKMGLKGSSTCQLNLSNVQVPVGNLLGEVGRGHKIAFNILNIGRFKLGVGCVGSSKRAIDIAIKYANERKQFRRPISSFGAIQEKLGRMVVQAFALESMCYRVAGYMDQSIDLIDQSAPDYGQKVMAAIEEYAVEDSIMKIYGSEVLSMVIDEALQIHGGYGYSEEYPMARAYRDARINRIFEGTNEINRLLIPGTLLKRTMKGQVPLFQAIRAVDEVLTQDKEPRPGSDQTLALERFLTRKAKALTIYTANQAIQKHMADLKQQQQLLLLLADMLIVCYALDSTVGRSIRLDVSDPGWHHKLVATRALVAMLYPQLTQNAEAVLEHLAGGDDAKRQAHYQALDKLTYRSGIDQISLLRELATLTIERERYPL